MNWSGTLIDMDIAIDNEHGSTTVGKRRQKERMRATVEF
jgi:hypothetical protein